MIKSERLHARTQRILVVDDHPLVRAGLSQVIDGESDLEVIAEAAGPVEALDFLDARQIDLAVVDLTLSSGSGLDLIKRMRGLHPEVSVLVVSMHDEALYAERVLRAGAMGYVNKQEASTQVVEAIHRVLSGKVYLSERMTERSLQLLMGSTQSPPPALGRLSDREMEVFLLIGQGMGTRKIAEQLHISIKTIETHRDKIKKKLGLSSAAELSRYATLWMAEQDRLVS